MAAEHEEIHLMMRIESRSTTGIFVVQDKKSINKSHVSMRLFGSTGEPDGRAAIESGTEDS